MPKSIWCHSDVTLEAETSGMACQGSILMYREHYYGPSGDSVETQGSKKYCASFAHQARRGRAKNGKQAWAGEMENVRGAIALTHDYQLIVSATPKVTTPYVILVPDVEEKLLNSTI